MESNIDFWLDNGHVSDEGAALMVDAFRSNQTQDVPVLVAKHIEECMECKDKIIDVTTFLRNVDSSGTSSPSFVSAALQKTGKPKWPYYLFKYAAIWVGIAVIAAIFILFFQGPRLMDGDKTNKHAALNQKGSDLSNGDSSRSSSTTAKIAESNNSSAGNTNISPVPVGGKEEKESKPNFQAALHNRFAVNPNLESMTGTQMRGTGFEVISPANNEALELPIHFAWKTSLDSPLTIKIVNNRNKTLYSYSVQGTSLAMNDALSVGLYYWKLESRNELVYVGKFFIRAGKK